MLSQRPESSGWLPGQALHGEGREAGGQVCRGVVLHDVGLHGEGREVGGQVHRGLVLHGVGLLGEGW